MERTLGRKIRPGRTQAGAALIEVLVAIFVMGVGLLSLLTLFPLGALAMAEAIGDDRTDAAASEAVAFSRAGEQLVSQTRDFVEASLQSGSVDREAAAALREGYEDYASQAAALEEQLVNLQSSFTRAEIQPYLGPLLAQLRAITGRISATSHLLALVDDD